MDSAKRGAGIGHRKFAPKGTNNEIDDEARRRSAGVRHHLQKNGIPIYAWEVCDAEEFIAVWLPKFESGELAPEDSPVTGYELEQYGRPTVSN